MWECWIDLSHRIAEFNTHLALRHAPVAVVSMTDRVYRRACND